MGGGRSGCVEEWRSGGAEDGRWGREEVRR
jgi:hypothetical protein